jgi:hypothetical protein
VSEPAGGKTAADRLWAAGKVVAAFVAGAITIAIGALALHDYFWPPVKVQGGEVVAADLVGVGVSYTRYVYQHPLYFPDPKKATLDAGAEANVPGAVVEVVLKMEGLRGRHCQAVFTVYRMPLTPVIGPTQALAKCTSHVQDGDEGGWAAWVPLPTPRTTAARQPVTQHYFIRFDLLDEHGQYLGPGKTTPVFGWNGVQVSR